LRVLPRTKSATCIRQRRVRFPRQVVSSVPPTMSEVFLSRDEKLATPSGRSWLERRHLLVEKALEKDDIGALRKISAMPGGFGSEEMRRRVWSVLGLGVVRKD